MTPRKTPARYNIAPTQDVMIYHCANDCAILEDAQWWLTPSWAKERSRYPTFNARGETAHEKANFGGPFKYGRCLIPASGYYEWTKGDDGGKDPWFIYHKRNETLSFAGLCAYNVHLELLSCAIITLPASKNLETIHHRMPVALDAAAWAEWIDPATTVLNAREMLMFNMGTDFNAHQFDRQINSNRWNGGSEAIQKIS